MKPSLDWQVGALGDEAGAAPPPPVVVPTRRSWARIAALTTVYVGALLAAAVVGFWLGRWQDVRQANLGGIANQLAVEDLAWREADRALYLSTFDMLTVPEPWLRDRAQHFAVDAPRSVRHVPVEVELVSPDVAAVTVRVEDVRGGEPTGGAAYVEARWYRAVGRSWLRTTAEAARLSAGGAP